MTETPAVTVVIPARNEEAFIGRCLESVLNQELGDLQIIVVDGASEDGTVDVVRDFMRHDARIELVHNAARIVPVALNLALAATRGRWLVRVDAHSTIPKDYVRRAVRHLSSGGYGGVGGRKDGVGVTRTGKVIAAVMGSRFGVGNSLYHYGTRTQLVDHVPFGCYDVAVARELGGWNAQLRVNQDYEFDYRLRARGHELLFDPRLSIDWHCRQTIGDLFRQYMRYGRGKVDVALLHPDSLAPRHFAAPLLVMGLLGLAAIAPRRPHAAARLLAPYAAAMTGATIGTAVRVRDPAALVIAPAAFLAMHIGWGLGFWRGIWQTVGSRRSPRA